jgi:aspartyl-tRNA(Asn)/glutamyl-tRNA(Gln) amidotransferase subunit A
VAAGVVPLALGTDTAGSIRIPAALCGVVGAKPARGTLPIAGVFPLSTTLDQVGVLAGSVADVRFAVGVLAGADTQGGPVPARPVIGVLQNPEPNDCAAEVTAAYRRAVDYVAADASLVEVVLPAWPELIATSLDIQGPEAAAVHAATFPARADAYQPDVRERLRAAAQVPGWRYVRARERAVELTAQVDRVLRTVDGLLLPTVPVLAPALDAHEAEVSGGRSTVRDLLLRNTRPLNLTGHPAVSIPVTGAELPVGLQVIAGDDGRALALAEWLAARL